MKRHITPHVFAYTEEFCITCDRVMQFELQSGCCVLCGGDNPFGLWEEHSDAEWDAYYACNRREVLVCSVPAPLGVDSTLL